MKAKIPSRLVSLLLTVAMLITCLSGLVITAGAEELPLYVEVTQHPGNANVPVNLSAIGDLDWAHPSSNTVRMENPPSGALISYKNLSTYPNSQQSDSPFRMSWTGGTPTATGTNSRLGLVFNSDVSIETLPGVECGYSFTVAPMPVDGSLQFLTNGWNVSRKLTITDTDTGAVLYADDLSVTDSTAQFYKVNLAKDQSVTVKAVFTGKSHAYGNVTLNAVMISSKQIADKRALTAALAAADAINRGAFTVASLAVLDTAVTAGRAVAASETAAQTEIKAAAEAIQAALNALEAKPPQVSYVTYSGGAGSVPVNLTTLGDIDWMYFNDPDVRKAPGDNSLISYRNLNTSYAMSFQGDSIFSTSWTDGATTATATGLTRGRVFNSSTSGTTVTGECGFETTIAALPQDASIWVYNNIWHATRSFTVYDADSNEVLYTDTMSIAGDSNSLPRVYRINGEKGKSYRIKSVMTAKTHNYGNVTLNAVVVNSYLWADRSALDAKITMAAGLNRNDYTTASFAALDEALNTGRTVSSDYKSTAAMISEAAAAIVTAMDALVPRFNVTPETMATLIANASGADLNVYTAASQNALTQAISAAQTALDNNTNMVVAYGALVGAVRALVPSGQYTYQTMSGLTGSFGWDGDKHAPIAYIDGSYRLRDGGTRYITFGVPNIPSKIDWTLAEGYLPCYVSAFETANLNVSIENFADKLIFNDNPFEVTYSRMTVTNKTEVTQILPPVSTALVPLNASAEELFVAPGETVVRDYAIFSDRFGGSYAFPSDTALGAAGGYDEHYAHMKAYWEDRVSDIIDLDLPDNELVNAYKAGFIFTHLIKDADALHVGENGYDMLFDHDTMGIVATLLTLGDYKDARTFLLTLPAEAQYIDAKWKYSWPFALYYLKSGDSDYVKTRYSVIRSNTREIHTDRITVNGVPYSGIMKSTFNIDSQGYWLIDDWSSLFGLSTYAWLSEELAKTETDETQIQYYLDEAAWALAEYDDLLAVVDKQLEETLEKYDLNYLPVSILEPNTANRCADPRDANWAAHLLFGRWAWDGYLFGARQEGLNLDLIDDTYTYGFDRLAGILPSYDFGGYPHGFYSSAYNAGYGSAGLRGTEWRDSGIKAYQFMINYAQSSPYGWWEGVNYPTASNPWSIADSSNGGVGATPGGGGSCQHMWGQSVASKMLVDALVSETGNRDLILGRGVPAEWLFDGEHYSVSNFPISYGKRFGYDLSVEDKTVTITFTGDKPEGCYYIDLPAAIGNIASVTGGSFDFESGRVTVENTTDTVTITLKKYPADSRELKKSITSAQKVDTSLYTKASVKRLTDAIATAQDYIANGANQATFDAAQAAIASAVAALVPYEKYKAFFGYTAGNRNNDYTFGQTSDQVRRYQTFTMNATETSTRINLRVTKRGSPSDLIVELWSARNGVPQTMLKTVTVPVSEVNGNGITTVNFVYDFVAGQQYALALSQVTKSNSNNYNWTTMLPRVATEQFGKYTGTAWVAENNLGTGWMEIESYLYTKRELESLIEKFEPMVKAGSEQAAVLIDAAVVLENADATAEEVAAAYAAIETAFYSPVQKLTLNVPANVRIARATTQNINISWNPASYLAGLSVASSNSSVVTATISANNLGAATIRLTALRTGTAVVTVKANDGTGTVAAMLVTVS